MTVSPGYSLLMILIMALIIFFQRATPFFLFTKGTPKAVEYLGKALPPAVMGMLIVYCLREVKVTSFPFGLPEMAAVVAVIILHLVKGNNLISILGGTVLYMVLIQVVF